MVTNFIVWRQVGWWEGRRILFNVLMAVTGIILLMLVQAIKPIHTHWYLRAYVDLILAYGLMANLAYTAAYVYVLLISQKFIEQTQIRDSLRDFTYKVVLWVGLLANGVAGVGELLFRLAYMK